MADRLEDRIRDFLGEHLGLLDVGLQLVEKEYRLPNPLGAAGKIDLVAKDSFGHIVIIEIKRSDQAARQALNEVHKYTALFRTLQGLDETRVRVIVVSTEWHELLLPLSEYAQTAKYTVDGIAITASADGTVTSAEKISFAERGTPLTLARAQAIYLFSRRERRDQNVSALRRAIQENGIEDYVLFFCDYVGANQAVIYRHAIYLAFVSPLSYVRGPALAELQKRIEWEDDLDLPDENFVCAVNKAFVGNWDDFEIGYPEKLATLRADWDVSIGIREGRLKQDGSLLTDSDLLGLALAVEGGSPIYLAKLSSPRFSAAWQQLRNDIGPVLGYNHTWEQVVPLFLDETQSTSPHASVSITIYNPGNLPMSLFSLSKGDSTKCPYLEIAVDHQEGQVAQLLVSILSWDGTSVYDSPAKMIERIYGSFSEWATATHFHETRLSEDEAMRVHGLSTPLVEVRYEDGRPQGIVELSEQGGALSRSEFSPGKYCGVSDFVAANRRYLESLQEFLIHRVGGLA